MTFRVSGKNLDVGDALRDRVSERIAEAMGNISTAAIPDTSRSSGKGSVSAPNAPSISTRKSLCMPRVWRPTPTPAPTRQRLRIEKRLRRYHRRLKDHRPERLDGRETVDAASYVIEAPPDDESGADSDGFTPAIIAELTTVLKLLSVSDAVTELDMTGAPLWYFGMPPMAASTWSTGAAMAILAGSIRDRRGPAMPIDVAAAGPYGPPPLEHDRRARARILRKIMPMQVAKNQPISAR